MQMNMNDQSSAQIFEDFHLPVSTFNLTDPLIQRELFEFQVSSLRSYLLNIVQFAQFSRIARRAVKPIQLNSRLFGFLWDKVSDSLNVSTKPNWQRIGFLV
jgi:hypothetical protein